GARQRRDGPRFVSAGPSGVCQTALSPAAPAGERASVQDWPLLHIRANHAVPLLRDDFLRRRLFVERREHGLLIGGGGRQLRQEGVRHLLVFHEILETDRMAVTRKLSEL